MQILVNDSNFYEIVAFLESVIGAVHSIAWGPLTLIALIGTGLLITIVLRGRTVLWLGLAVREIMASVRADLPSQGISAARALSTAMSSTAGVGNLAGVATAISLGGPGAVFWMWIAGLVGMSIKYSEAVCAVTFRERGADGLYRGGPMAYIDRGLGPKFKWLGLLFALFGIIASFGIGNMVQANTVGSVFASSADVHPLLFSLIMPLAVLLVIVGGVKSISSFTSKLVPTLRVMYVLAALGALIINIEHIPQAFAVIISAAFTDQAAVGGFAGATVVFAIQFGISRGVFASEAGMGSGAIAHAAAEAQSPVSQGRIAMLGTFIDTLIVCASTGLVIVASGAWQGGAVGIEMTSAAFSTAYPKVLVDTFLPMAVFFFAFSTILGWSYYGERCCQHLCGDRITTQYRILFGSACAIGPWVSYISLTDEVGARAIELLWLVSDTANAFMIIPNLIALLLLLPIIWKLTFSADGGRQAMLDNLEVTSTTTLSHNSHH